MVHLEEHASEEASVVSSNVSRKSKASHKSGKDPISAKAKATAAQAYVRKQKEIAKEKLREIESQAELQRKSLKSKEEAERVRLEAELELEKQRSISEEAQKTRELELELEVIRLEVEAKALEKEAHDPDNSQERLKDFEDEETIPASHNQENYKEIKPDEVPENPMTSDVAYMSTSTPKPGTKHQQLEVKFQDKEEASNKGLHVETYANTIILRPSLDSLPKLKLG